MKAIRRVDMNANRRRRPFGPFAVSTLRRVHIKDRKARTRLPESLLFINTNT